MNPPRWFFGLPAGERRALTLGALALAALLFYFLLWEPLAGQRAMLREQVAAQQALRDWMRQAAQEVEVLRGGAGAPAATPEPGLSLLGAIDQSLRGLPLEQANKRIEPKGENLARVEFTSVEFDALIGWLADLQGRYGVRVNSAGVERLTDPGQVKAWLGLEHGNRAKRDAFK